MDMTLEMEIEVRTLIQIAIAEAHKAFEAGDLKTANWFKEEAADLLAMLPEEHKYSKVMQ